MAVSPAAATASAHGSPGSAAVLPTSGGLTWGTAAELPGLAALGAHGTAGVRSMSCGAPGYCVAGGGYNDAAGHQQALVAVEAGGAWHAVREVPGTAALNAGNLAAVTSVSCASAGNCAVVGYYRDAGRQIRGFAASLVAGRWHDAVTLPGTGALSAFSLPETAAPSVSCGAAGNCVAGGLEYPGTSGKGQGFLSGEVNGTWQPAIAVPGMSVLGQIGQNEVSVVSCTSARNCAAAGTYQDASYNERGFVVDEANGTWHSAIEVPGLAVVKHDAANVTALSCSSAGNCAVGGYDHRGAFAASEIGGTWKAAQFIKVTVNGSTRPAYSVDALSCPSAGNCSAAGLFHVSTITAVMQPFFVSEVRGSWRTGAEVAGLAALVRGMGADIGQVSCISAGNCVAGGEFSTEQVLSTAYVVSEVGGTWGSVRLLPGLAALNKGGNSGVGALSCVLGYCAIAGNYADKPGNTAHSQVFTDSAR